VPRNYSVSPFAKAQESELGHAEHETSRAFYEKPAAVEREGNQARKRRAGADAGVQRAIERAEHGRLLRVEEEDVVAVVGVTQGCRDRVRLA